VKRALVSFLLAGCAASDPPPTAPMQVQVDPQPQPQQQQPIPPLPPQPAMANTLHGTIGGKPFVATNALLAHVNEQADTHSSVYPGQTFTVTWSFLFISDGPMTCADAQRLAPRVDRYVRFQVQGHWPLPDGSSYPVTLEPSAPTADGFSGGIWRGSSGSNLRGVVKVAPGAVDLDVSTVTSNSDTSGVLTGSIAVAICPK
jgi:hypothetical protein